MKTPSLDAWRRELAAGQRTATTFDWLWRAACEEMNALEAPTPALAKFYLVEAQRIVRKAIKTGRSRVPRGEGSTRRATT
jgi:hypothetical protein